jgi:hypothetical protein
MDGDSVEIENTKIRLSGIDALETHPLQFCLDPAGEKWDCGVITARDELIEHVGGKPWTCHVSGTDRIGEASRPAKWMAKTFSNGWCGTAGPYHSSGIVTATMPTSAPHRMHRLASGRARLSRHGIGDIVTRPRPSLAQPVFR